MLDQWKPNPGPDFLKRILLWIRIKGIPIHYMKKEVVESIVEPLGKVDAVELHARNSSSLEYVRARTWINADEPLQFWKSAYFKTGEVASIELTYEKLLKVCFLCKRLTHDQTQCPFQVREQPENRGGRQTTKKEPSRKKRKGKEIVSGEDLEITQPMNMRKSVLSAPPEPVVRHKSVKDRLQWSSQGERRRGQVVQQEWRPKERMDESVSLVKEQHSRGEATPSLSKRRRLSGSEERQPKKAKIGSSGKKSKSPSVFERLGNSGDKANSGDNGRSKDQHASKEGSKSSPTVIEKAGISIILLKPQSFC